MSNEKSVDWVLTEIDEPFVQQHVFASNSGVRVVTTVDGKVVCSADLMCAQRDAETL